MCISRCRSTRRVTCSGRDVRRRFWPVRRYPWGNCEALSSVHSDLPALKRLLFEARPEHPVSPAPVCR